MNDFINVGATDLVPTPFTGTVGTDFLTFAVGGGANVEAQADYLADPQRPTGNLPGIARSNFNNKAIRQGTFVAHSLCLWISQQILEYVPDDGDDIKWIGEWGSALSNYVLSMLPAGPNLGAYLPLAGGTMSGNIQFQSGVSTVLANNTWYYAKDTVGTNRGLILKSSDNNVYINDGSSAYVMFNGVPVTNNNVSWSGKETGGTARPLIGFLSDNAVHVGGGPAVNIYIDTTSTGAAYFAGAAVFTNNLYLYWRDTGNTLRPVLGLNTANALVIGSGVTGTTNIYAGAGQLIYLQNNTNALGLLTVNQYTYMNGGGRCYVPGGHDPFQVYSDNGFYARIHYIVGGVRDWTAGCTNAGLYSIADESAHAVRWEIDLSGHVHAYQSLYVSGLGSFGSAVYCSGLQNYGGETINGGLTVYNSLNVASGNLTVSGGTYAYNSLNVYNGLAVNSGSLFAAGAGQVNGGLTVFNSLNMASGTMTANGPLNCYGHLYAANFSVGGTGWMVDAGGNQTNWDTNLYIYGSVNAGYLYSRGNVGCWDVNSGGGVYTGYLYSYGALQVNGGGTVNGSLRVWGPHWANVLWSEDYTHVSSFLDVYGAVYARNTLQVWNPTYLWSDVVIGGHGRPNSHGGQLWGGCDMAWFALYSFNYVNTSDVSQKQDIAPLPPGCLNLVDALQPKTFKWRIHPETDDHGQPLRPESGLVGTHWGFVYQDVAEVMHNPGRKGPDFAGAYLDRGMGNLVYNELTSILWQAVRELSEKVKKLEAQLH